MTKIHVHIDVLKAAASLIHPDRAAGTYRSHVLVQATRSETRVVATNGLSLVAFRETRAGNEVRGDVQMLIPASLIANIKRLRRPRVDEVQLTGSATDGVPRQLIYGDTSTALPAVGIRYPEYSTLFADDAPTAVVPFPADELTLVHRAFCMATGAVQPRIRLAHRGPGHAVHVYPMGKHSVDFVGAIMPYTGTAVGTAQPDVEWIRNPPSH